MKIEITKKVDQEVKYLKIHLKPRDEGSYTLYDESMNFVIGKDGVYVPGFIPGAKYGDYITLLIDLETGTIADWRVSKNALQSWVEENSCN